MNTRVTNTTRVYLTTSWRFGHATLASSLRTSRSELDDALGRARAGSGPAGAAGGRRGRGRPAATAGRRALFVDLALSLQETLRLSVHATILGSKER